MEQPIQEEEEVAHKMVLVAQVLVLEVPALLFSS
jgi:hypothetical protein